MNTYKNIAIGLIIGLSTIFASEAKIAAKTANLTDQSLKKSNINLTVESDADILGVQFDIKYDPSELSLSENGIISKVPGINIYSSVKEDDGIARVLMFSLRGDKILDIKNARAADFMEINFEPAENFHGTSQVELIDVILAGEAGKEVSSFSSTFDVSFVTPKKTSLSENYPNPFNPSTTIKYELSKAGMVSVIIYDLKGAEVTALVNKHQEADYYNILWNGLNSNGQAVASGRYIVKMTAPGFSKTITMTLLK